MGRRGGLHRRRQTDGAQHEGSSYAPKLWDQTLGPSKGSKVMGEQGRRGEESDRLPFGILCSASRLLRLPLRVHFDHRLCLSSHELSLQSLVSRA